MAEFVKRHSLFISSVALIAGSFQLMSSSIENPELPKYGAELLNTTLSPIEEVHSTGISSIQDNWNHYLWLQNVEEENRSLKNRIALLEAENSKLVENAHENSRLRKLLNYSEGSTRHGLTGTVIGRDPSNWIRSVTIDIGEEEGVQTGLPVVDGHAVVGLTLSLIHI